MTLTQLPQNIPGTEKKAGWYFKPAGKEHHVDDTTNRFVEGAMQLNEPITCYLGICVLDRAPE